MTFRAALTLLAQIPAPGKPTGAGEATAWMFALLAGVLLAFVVAGIVIYIVRSRALREETTADDVPLSLADVRRMHESGEIDEEEMGRLKGIVTAQARRERPKPPPADPQELR